MVWCGRYRKEQVKAIQRPIRGCKIKAAPAPSDIVWPNIKYATAHVPKLWGLFPQADL